MSGNRITLAGASGLCLAALSSLVLFARGGELETRAFAPASGLEDSVPKASTDGDVDPGDGSQPVASRMPSQLAPGVAQHSAPRPRPGELPPAVREARWEVHGQVLRASSGAGVPGVRIESKRAGTVAEQDGDFVLGTLPEESLLSGALEGWITVASTRLDARTRAEEQRVLMEPARSLAVRVVSGPNHVPVQDVGVALIHDWSLPASEGCSLELHARPHSAVTDASGWSRVPVAEGLAGRLTVLANDGRHASLEVPPQADDVYVVRLEGHAGLALRGRCVDPGGHPVAGVRLDWAGQESRSDDTGRFCFSPVPAPDAAALLARADDLGLGCQLSAADLAAMGWPEVGEVEVRLRAANVTLAGRLRDDALPLEGWVVAVGDSTSGLWTHGVTDAVGAFEVRGWTQAAQVDLEFSSKHSPVRGRRGGLALPADAPLDVDMDLGATLEGLRLSAVDEATGEALVARVIYLPPTADLMSRRPLNLCTTVEEALELPTLADEGGTLRVSVEGYSAAEIRLDGRHGGELLTANLRREAEH
ncbi:MAG: hypothetical protein ACYS26_08615 [Planctomycetota bacterium]|jgi:hypothetical protein